QDTWRSFQYDPHKSLRDLKLQVEEAAKTWLQPERCSSEEVVRRVSLQKFLSLLPPGAQEKTRKQQPQNLEEALIMAACFMEDNRVEQEEPERDRQSEICVLDRISNYSPHFLPVQGIGLVTFQSCPHLNPLQSNANRIGDPGLRGTVGTVSSEMMMHPLILWDHLAVFNPMLVDTKPVLNLEVVHPIVNDSNEMSLPGTCYGNKSTTPSLRSAFKNCDRQVQHHKPEAPVKHALECPTCGSKFKRFDYLQRHRCTPGQSLGCKHCDLRFPTLTQLTNHLRIHRKMLRCPVCNKTFRDRFNLRCHQRTHTAATPVSCERPHICTDCGSSFAQERGLLEHRNIHTGEKPFQCPVCRKGFRHSRTLSKHVVLHSEARPFGCSDCGRTFKIKDNLYQHQKKIHHRKCF
uniref:Uncharacterized protein n=1 Tax=Astyanax mexicanus TaxID=7994 RepID=A0A8B9J628_ASTMX